MRRVTTRGNVHQRERPRPSVVARSRASRARFARIRRRARSLDDAARSLARADRRLADAPSDSRASDSRASRGGVESKRRALLARVPRDARAIRDSRPTDGSSLARRARARRRARRGRGRASPCAASRASTHRRGRADRPRPTDRVFSLCTHTKRFAHTVCPYAMAPCAGDDHPSRRARRRQSTTTTTTTMLAQRAQAFATGGATVASRARARATRGRTGRRAQTQTRAGIPIHIEYCEK